MERRHSRRRAAPMRLETEAQSCVKIRDAERPRVVNIRHQMWV